MSLLIIAKGKTIDLSRYNVYAPESFLNILLLEIDRLNNIKKINYTSRIAGLTPWEDLRIQNWKLTVIKDEFIVIFNNIKNLDKVINLPKNDYSNFVENKSQKQNYIQYNKDILTGIINLMDKAQKNGDDLVFLGD